MTVVGCLPGGDRCILHIALGSAYEHSKAFILGIAPRAVQPAISPTLLIDALTSRPNLSQDGPYATEQVSMCTRGIACFAIVNVRWLWLVPWFST